jgi:hypothetical protein
LPVLNNNKPDCPTTAEFAVRITTEPLVLTAPPPDNTSTVPPELREERVAPARRFKEPPDPEDPDPTTKEIAPPLPARALPVATTKRPELPDDVVPLEKRSCPETPLTYTLAVRNTISPLPPLVDEAADLINTRPAVPPTYVVLPADSTTEPPSPEFVDPTVTLIAPALPNKASPVYTFMNPVEPDADVPLFNSKKPEAPALDVSAVRIVILPDDEDCPAPDRISTIPPDAPAFVDAPDTITTFPLLLHVDLPASTLMDPARAPASPEERETKPEAPEEDFPVTIETAPEAASASEVATTTFPEVDSPAPPD